MFFRRLLNDETACASYLLGCKSRGEMAVVDPHADLVDTYVALADAQGARISAALETHVQADHLSGMAALVERTGATAYMPAGADVESTTRRSPTRVRCCRPRGCRGITCGEGSGARRPSARCGRSWL